MKKIFLAFLSIFLITGCSQKNEQKPEKQNQTNQSEIKVKEVSFKENLIDEDVYVKLQTLINSDDVWMKYRMVDVNESELLIINEPPSIDDTIQQYLFNYDFNTKEAKIEYQFPLSDTIYQCAEYDDQIIYTTYDEQGHIARLFINDQLIYSNSVEPYAQCQLFKCDQKVFCLIFEEVEDHKNVILYTIDGNQYEKSVLYDDLVEDSSEELFFNANFIYNHDIWAIGMDDHHGLNTVYLYHDDMIDTIKVNKKTRLTGILENKLIFSSQDVYDLKNQQWESIKFSKKDIFPIVAMNDEMGIVEDDAFYSLAYFDQGKLKLKPFNNNEKDRVARYIPLNEHEIIMMYQSIGSGTISSKISLYQVSIEENN